ncbi:DUF2163 domain-containing protein [Brucellaceae bacterium C25G]
MRSISPQLESHLEGIVTNHCFVWIIRSSDQRVLGFTDHDFPLVVKGVTCEPQSGMNSSEAHSKLGLAISGSEIEGALVSEHICEEDIENGLYDDALVETYLVNWNAPDNHLFLQSWTIGKITRSGQKFIAEIKGAAAAYDKIHGRRILRQCNAALGDQHCGIISSDPRYHAKGMVVSVNGADMEMSGLSNHASDWFLHGALTWISGRNTRTKSKVTLHRGNLIRLRDQPVFAVETGDEFELLAGCDKSFSMCKAKFANSINFRGFPHLPGNDAAYSYINKDMNFDGGALVP